MLPSQGDNKGINLLSELSVAIEESPVQCFSSDVQQVLVYANPLQPRNRRTVCTVFLLTASKKQRQEQP